MIPFSAQCQAHRAALYRLHGAWSDAYSAALIAEERFERGDRDAAYGAFYQKGEIERLRGEFEEAEASYRRAGETGWEPQPGLALLSLARDHRDVALALIRGAIEGADPATRQRMLPRRLLGPRRRVPPQRHGPVRKKGRSLQHGHPRLGAQHPQPIAPWSTSSWPSR
jgi:hypothetical protein